MPRSPVAMLSSPTGPVRGYCLQWQTRQGQPRHLNLSQPVVYALGVAFGVAVVWALLMTAYVIARDEFTQAMAAAWEKNEQSYEMRIASLAGQLDRAAARRREVAGDEGRRLALMAERQAQIERNQAMFDRLLAGLAPVQKNAMGDDFGPLRAEMAAFERQSAENALEKRITASEVAHAVFLQGLEWQVQQKNHRMRMALAEIGLQGLTAKAAQPAATGGPFVPLTTEDALEQRTGRLVAMVAEMDHLRLTAAQLPLWRPMGTGEGDITSAFGARLDPFVKNWAMHAGIDFRGNPGAPISATAAGTVVSAGWQGSYGYMVEVAHGQGVSTRYGHMSQIDVRGGDTVRQGQVLGRVGSSGRSTGPHLHYETRVDGQPVDPMRFLRAGARL